jgi:phosphoglucosamine mutase
MSKYPQTLVNVRVSEKRDPETVDAVLQAKVEAEKELNGSGRVLLRSSGTEPLIRVMVEGKDVVLVDDIANRLAEVVKASMA